MADTQATRRRLAGGIVLAGYVLVAFVYLGLAPLLHGGSEYSGAGYDPQIFIWGFAWYPHAILSGLNPFWTHAVWAPPGVDLAWTTTVPGLALLFWPLTALAGPILSYDVAAVLMPALSAWTAYLLCRYLTKKLWPSVVGGYLFGFSLFVVAQAGYGGHLNLSTVFLIPLVALLVLRYLDGALGGRGLAVRLGPVLALQILVSTELAFTVTLALAISVLIGLAVAPARRRRLVALLWPLVGAYAFAAVLTAPFLYYVLAHLRTGIIQPSGSTIDPLNLVIPTKLIALGGGLLTAVSKRFPSNLSEQGGYLGIPTLVIIALFARDRWRTPSGRYLLVVLGLVVFVACGGRLVVDGHSTIWLPWSLLQSQPVFDNVLPMRFMVFAALAAAVLVAIWTAGRRPGVLRWLLPGLAIVAVVPWPGTHGFATAYHVPAFFTDSAYRSCLDPGERIVPLPYRSGDDLLWQVASGFRFQMAAGDLGPDIPYLFEQPSGIPFLAQQPLGVTDAGVLRRFLAGKGVTSIVLDANDANDYAGAVDQVASPEVVGGVYLYHLTPNAPSC